MPGAPSIVDRIFDGLVLQDRRASASSRADIVELVVRGGYPIAVGLAPAARSRWFANLATLETALLHPCAEAVPHPRRSALRPKQLGWSSQLASGTGWPSLRSTPCGGCNSGASAKVR